MINNPKTLVTLRFSDLKQKLDLISQQMNAQFYPLTEHAVKLQAVKIAHEACINAHGRFYGLRSKYDGRGNLRTPVKA